MKTLSECLALFSSIMASDATHFSLRGIAGIFYIFKPRQSINNKLGAD